MKLSPGTTIGRYTVEEMVGEGGMATVFRVRHNELHATYALKVLNLVSDAIQRRLVQEGRVQARLRHPNILPVTDILDVDGRPGLIMEYVDGPSLEAHLAPRRLPLDEADQLARGILSAVVFAHGQGCVHRDLKPANILLSDIGGEYIPKVADFGLVKVIDEEDDSLHKTRSGIGIGTPCYMAPEQALDAAHVDERADIFSLGAILYELVCGRRAFHGPNAVAIILRIAAGDFVPPEEIDPEIPARFLEAIHGAMQIDRKLRIQDCMTLRAVWQGKEHYQLPVAATPDATWSDEQLLGASDAGLTGLQDIIRSIAARTPQGGSSPSSSLQASAAQTPSPATAVPLPSMLHQLGEPQPIELDRTPSDRYEPPAPEDEPPDAGTLADHDAVILDAGAESISDGLVGVGPAETREPHPISDIPEPPPAPVPKVSPPQTRLQPPEPPPAPTPLQPSSSPPAPTPLQPSSSPPEPETHSLKDDSWAEIEVPHKRRRSLPFLLMLVGLAGALVVGGAGVIGLGALLQPGTDNTDIEPPAIEKGTLGSVLASHDDHAPIAQPPKQPETSIPPDPSTEPVPSELKTSVDEPSPEVVAMRPEPSTKPEPSELDAAVDEPSPKVVATPSGPKPHQTPQTGVVTVSGDMISVALISASGRRRAPGEVPLGTYDLEVSFANGKTVTRTDMVRVTAGTTVSIRCSSRVENCR